MDTDGRVENLVILGSGAAGLTAAVYAARADLEPLVLEGMQPGGQLTINTEVENFPGFPAGVQGPELMELVRTQADRFGARRLAEQALEVDLGARPFTLRSDQGTYRCKSLIIATGASARFLGLPSEQRFLGRGVSACATCDGFFFRDQEVMVIGGGDSACEEALFLTKFAKRVRVVHRRDRLRASKIMQDRVLGHDRVEVLWNSVVEEILGEEPKGVTGIRLRSTVTGETFEERCDGVFVAIGHTPNTEIFTEAPEKDERGYIRTYRGTLTSVEGVFAAGDVQDSRYRQAVTAAGSGCMAALDAGRYLEERGEIG